MKATVNARYMPYEMKIIIKLYYIMRSTRIIMANNYYGQSRRKAQKK